MVDGKSAVLSAAKAVKDATGGSKYRLYAEKTEQIGGNSILLRIVRLERKDGQAVFTRKMDIEAAFACEKLTNEAFYAFICDMERSFMPCFDMCGRMIRPKNSYAVMENGTAFFRFSVEFCDDDLIAGEDYGGTQTEMEELIYGFTENRH